ncbi:hypothetical protein DAI22_07g161100 [Oryza sativa Japonica Group]|nr:hypothetical protein DAI22_07g161100 [Oryza sativa Japonica Group]
MGRYQARAGCSASVAACVSAWEAPPRCPIPAKPMPSPNSRTSIALSMALCFSKKKNKRGRQMVCLYSLARSTSAAAGAPASGAHATPPPAVPNVPLSGLLAVGRRSPDLQRAKIQRRRLLGDLAAATASTCARPGVCPAPDSTTHVSATPEPATRRPCSFADAVRTSPGAILSPPAPQPPTRPTLKSVFTVPSPRHDAYRRAYELDPRERRDILLPRCTTPSPAFKPRPAFMPAEQGWTKVKPRRWWREKGHSSQSQRPDSRRQDGAGHAPGRRGALSLEEFRARTRGRCFVCLASDHRASACRDPPRCFTCNRTGHRARHCTSPRLAHRPPHPPTRSARLPRAASPSSHHSTRAARASPRTSRSRTPCPHRRHALSDRHDNPPPRRERQQALALRAATPRFPLLHNR